MWGIRFCGLLRKTTRKSPEEVGPPPQAARRRQGPSEGSAGCFGRQRGSSSVPRSLTQGGRGLTGRRWRAARREQAGGPAEGATRGRGLCRRDEPPSTTWPRKPRPERGGAGLRPARLARPRLPRHRRGRPATRGLGSHRTRSRQSPGPPSLGGDGEVPARQGGRENPLQVLAARRGRDACRTALPVSRTGSIPGIMQQVTGTSSLAQAPRTPQGPWPSLRRVSHSSVLGREGTDSCSPRLPPRPRQCRTEGGP